MGLSNFVISVRNVKDERFGSEPGPTTYLEVPDGTDAKPEHEITQKRWLDKVLKRAKTGEHNRESNVQLEGYATGDILIFIHGYNNSIKDIMDRHNLLQKRLTEQGFKGAIISFDWPSATMTLNYMEDRSDAKATASRLVHDGIKILAHNQLLQDKHRCDIDVHLLGHSTGAYVIREAFYEASQTKSVSRVNWQVSQIALIGGDISRKAMSVSDSKSHAFFQHSIRVTNYQNPHDSALKISNVKRLGTAPRVGRVGLPDDPPESVVNVNVGPHWEGLDEDDSTAGGNWSHSWHFDDPVFAKDLKLTIDGDIDRHALPTRVMQSGHLILKEPT